MSSPAASSTISSQRGSPPTVGARADRGRGRRWPASARGPATRDGPAGQRAPTPVPPPVDCAGEDAGCLAGDADPVGALPAPGRGIASTVPGADRIRVGADHPPVGGEQAGQPPRVPSAAAMPDRVSPALTVYRPASCRPGSARTVPGRMRPGSGPTGPPVGRVQGGPAAGGAERGSYARQRVAGLHDVAACARDSSGGGLRSGGRGAGAGVVAVVVTLLVRVTWVVPVLLVVLVMLAMRVFAWAGRKDPDGSGRHAG